MKVNKTNTAIDLFHKISTVILNAQKDVRRTVNTIMVKTYWAIGQIIVEEEQAGNEKAEYGKINT